MDDDIFPDYSVVNAKKTYRAQKRAVRRSPERQNDMDDEKPRPLTTKIAVKFLLEGRLKSKVCRYCLNITAGLSELDQIMKIGGTGSLYKVTIRDIVASFHPFKVAEDPNFPNKICQKCLDRALSAYLFTQQCEQAERAMLNCFDDMYEKFEKLDPIDRPKKRGRQKLNPNYNILHAEHEKVMDYAEPIINIVNIEAEALTKEPESNELECKKCWQVLPNMESLLNHEKVHPKTMWYHCRLCGKSFPKRNQLKKHNHRVHILGKETNSQVDTNFKCKECNHVTDNFIQHFQHMEKHKFKSLMEHIIEKKMDSLCVICFNKGSHLNELDKMVCMHGGHPDLMGDKTLYHVLASTLPNPKSYKYQELLIPSEAQIMTISKRPYSYEETSIKKIKSTTHSEDVKENFVFSNPIVVTKNRFKTDHFYFYVFCEPENLMFTDVIVCDFTNNTSKIKNLCTTKTPKLVEVCEIDEIEANDDVDDVIITKRRKISPNNVKSAKSIFQEKISEEFAKWAIKTAIVTKNMNNTLDMFAPNKAKVTEYIDDDKTKEMKEQGMVIEEIKEPPFYYDINKENIKKQENTASNYTFTSPIFVYNDCDSKDVTIDNKNTEANVKQSEYTFLNPDNIKTKQDMDNIADAESQSMFSKPENIFRQYALLLSQKEKTVTKYNEKRLTEDLCNTCWVFKGMCEVCKPRDNVAVSITTDIVPKVTTCRYCWIFKHVENCCFCKKPTEELDITKKHKDSKEFNINTESIKSIKDEKIWQCNVCLTKNNSDRISCHCCGTIKTTEYSDIKIPFGNNTFFQTKAKETEITDTQNKVTEIKNGIDTPKDSSNKFVFIEETALMEYKSNSEETNNGTHDNMQTMDIESNASFNITDEQMEVDHNPITLNTGLEWNAASMFNFNIGSLGNDRPTIGTTLQFNIGCVAKPKLPPKKIKKLVRIPKAFHK